MGAPHDMGPCSYQHFIRIPATDPKLNVLLPPREGWDWLVQAAGSGSLGREVNSCGLMFVKLSITKRFLLCVMYSTSDQLVDPVGIMHHIN